MLCPAKEIHVGRCPKTLAALESRAVAGGDLPCGVGTSAVPAKARQPRVRGELRIRILPTSVRDETLRARWDELCNLPPLNALFSTADFQQ